MSRLHPTLQGPEIPIDDTALASWQHDHLADAEELLTAAIPRSRDAIHHVLASRALVRTRLGQWDAAIVDAEEVVPILLTYVDTDTILHHQVHQDSAIRHWLHCKICRPCWQRENK